MLGWRVGARGGGWYLQIHEGLASKDHAKELGWVLCSALLAEKTCAGVREPNAPKPESGTARALPYKSYCLRKSSLLRTW